ncbi:hypothetical protein IR148_00470 [Dysgonomonas mossii]|uniref:ASCH domain-containing protein n=1 Tax=Dysgonomonas mossii TaxID=163665 RepID=A0A4Y9IQG8_9BACT|nr:hypothetical protein [Dysgonomonas mossii]MBF0759515.1 hypothetical protein [Dysgonomonas mossii]TFU90486.1 hypothetical protein E4T88_00475 [Dysgonomonas mossii]
MERTITDRSKTPQQYKDKWILRVESKQYGVIRTHILLFNTEAEANNTKIGDVYSTDNILREAHERKPKALSVQQPFALLEVLGIKDVENRSWETSYRGRIYIHACGTKKKSIYSLTESQQEIVSDIPLIGTLLKDTQMMYSAIIGHVDLVAITENSSSIWAIPGHYHWILANPVMFETPIVNVKGNLNLWNCNEHLKGKSIHPLTK